MTSTAPEPPTGAPEPAQAITGASETPVDTREPITGTEPAQDTAADTEPGTEEEAQDKPGKEAAKYRRQLRATETERDTLRGTVETLQKQIVEDIAARGHRITKPSALWKADGFNIEALTGEDGRIDPNKVGAAVKTAVETLGLRQNGGLPAAPNAAREGRNNPDPAGAWSKLLSGKD